MVLPAIASPLVGLKSQFLDARSVGEQMRIFDLSSRAAQALKRWAEHYPLIRQVRVWPLAVSVAAAAPYSSPAALISTARMSLWVFALDDLFDEEGAPLSELLRRVERYRAIATGETPGQARDSLAGALLEIRDDLARYPLFATLQQQWAAALCGTIDGMVQEYDWRVQYRRNNLPALPSYDEYLQVGRYSIGGPPHVWAALITTGDLSTPDHVLHLRAMEEQASICIRLANDLKSYEKELGEGNINGLVLLRWLYQRQGYSAERAYRQAESKVHADIGWGLRQLAHLQAGARTTSRRPEATIADIARFVCDFYTRHDYHTLTTGQTNEVLH